MRKEYDLTKATYRYPEAAKIQLKLNKALKHLKRLLGTANHSFNCKFDHCTCGKAQLHSDAQLDANAYLRDLNG